MVASSCDAWVDETLAVLGDFELLTDEKDAPVSPVVIDAPDIEFDIVDFMSFVDLDSSAFTAALKAPVRSRRKRAAPRRTPQTPKPPRKFRRTEILALRQEVETLTTQLRKLQRARSRSHKSRAAHTDDECSSGGPNTHVPTPAAQTEARLMWLNELRTSEATNKRLKRQIAKQLEQHAKLVDFLHELTNDESVESD